jgi:hypothetical protein
MRSPTGLLFIPQMIYAYGEPRWNDTDRGKPKIWEKILSHCHFVHHKFHMDQHGSKPGLCGERPATNRLSHGIVMYKKRNYNKTQCEINTNGDFDCTGNVIGSKSPQNIVF